MEEWKEYKLGDVVNVLDYKRVPLSSKERSNRKGVYPYYGAQGVIDYIDDYIFDGTYLLIAEDGENLKSQKQNIAQLATGKYWVNNHAHIVESNGLCDIRYLCYLLNTMDISGYITGSAQPKLNQANMTAISVILPSKNTQKRIADSLSFLDNKIEVNRRINENLEQQAQALFKSWFVDFEPFKNGEFVESELGMIPKGWRVVSLDEMTSKFGTGLNPRKNFKLGEGNNYYVTIKNMGNNRVYLDDKCDKVTDDAIEKINKRSKLQEGDLLFSGIGTIGRVALVTQTPTNWNTSESVFNMHPTQNISSEFLYILLLSDVFQQYVKIHAQGGVQQGIRMASLKEYRMAIPEDSLLRKFDDIVMPIISRIKNNDNQSDSLAELRDTLLPKLMSGELRVQDTDLINEMLEKGIR